MKPLTVLTPQDKIELLFDLFPTEVTPFIAFVLDATVLVRRSGKLGEMLWQDKHYTFKQFRLMIDSVETNLLKYMDSKEQNNALLALCLAEGVLHFWTERCLLQYLCLDTNLKFTLAHELFFNPNPPEIGSGNFIQLFNN